MCVNPNKLKYLNKLPLRSSFVKRNNIIPRNRRIDLEHYFKYYLPEFDAGYKLAEQYCGLAEHPLRCWDKHQIINRFNEKYKHTSYLFKQGFNDFIKEVEQNKNDKYLFSSTGRLHTRERLKIKQFTSNYNLVLNSKSEVDYKNQIKFKHLINWLKSLNFQITLLSNETEAMFVGLNIKGYVSINPQSSIYQKIAIDNIGCFNKVSRCPVIIYLSDNKLKLNKLYAEFKSLGSKEGYELSNHDEYKPRVVDGVRW